MPEWLTSVLHQQGFAKGIEVKATTAVLSKRLPYSSVHRILIEYTAPIKKTEAPESLFLKICGPNSSDKTTEGIGRTEVEFYRNVAPQMNCPPLIRCYDAAFSEESGQSHILLDDLFETHSQPDQNVAPSVSQTRSAIEALAKVHSHWWNNPSLGNGIGTLLDDKALHSFIENLNTNVRRFVEHIGEGLTSEQKDSYERMLASAERIWGRLAGPDGLTVTHGDCHWWNFLYPNDPETHSVHLFDWHLWHIDLGARDLAFLLALGGFAEPRPEIEADLLQHYLEVLKANGVEHFSFDDLWNDYRWSSIRNLNIPVIFWSQGKHESTWKTALDRAFSSFDRLECGELIE